jgi:hypothetical protein
MQLSQTFIVLTVPSTLGLGMVIAHDRLLPVFSPQPSMVEGMPSQWKIQPVEPPTIKKKATVNNRAWLEKQTCFRCYNLVG